MTAQTEIKGAEAPVEKTLLLRRLGDQFVVAKFTEDNAKKVVEDLKVEIRALVKEIGPDALDTEKSTSYMNLIDGQALKVTRSEEDPPPPVDPTKFLAQMGPERFFKFVKVGQLTIPSRAFDGAAWALAEAEELVKESDLLNSLGVAPDPREWSVGLAKARPE